jgi:tetratricopeptide (TPR) repeat protein
MRPEYPAAHEFYGYYLSAMGRTNEAIKERQTARDLEPLSPIFNAALGEAYFQARQFDRSIEETQKSLDADPSYEDALMNIARAYEQKGMYDRSEAVLRQLLARAPEEPAILSMAGHEYAVSGHRSQAREIISRLESIAGRRYVPPLYFALIYIGLGDRDKAFQFLNKAYDERSEYLLYLPTEPLADPLRNDPRFPALLGRLGLTVGESSRAVRSGR